MRFTTTTSVLALAATAFSAPVEERATKPFALHTTYTNSFGLLEGTLQAHNGYLYVHQNSSAYCPSSLGSNCPPTPANTTFTSGTTGGVALNVVVPGGQQVFVGPAGNVRYTIPHSADMPAGSNITGIVQSICKDGTVESAFSPWLCTLKGEASNVAHLVMLSDPEAVPKQGTVCTRTELVAKTSSEGAAWEY